MSDVIGDVVRSIMPLPIMASHSVGVSGFALPANVRVKEHSPILRRKNGQIFTQLKFVWKFLKVTTGLGNGIGNAVRG